MRIELTKEEDKAIKALQKVAKIWPKSLWLFSASCSLNVMKYKENGMPGLTASDAIDADYSVRIIDISNDGGDW